MVTGRFESALFVWTLLGSCAVSAQGRAEFSTGAVLPPPELYDASPRQAMLRAAVPVRVDLTPFAPLPDTQGPQGSCAAWATTYAARTILGTMQGAAREATFSPAYTFNLGKQIQAKKYGKTSMSCQSGLMIPVALDLLRDSGAVTWAKFPYDASSCDRLPTSDESASAAQAKIGGWATLETRDSVRQALAQSRPVVFSMKVGKAFFDWSGSNVYSVTTSAQDDGLHAMTIIGYDDEKAAFRVINSWGKQWGDGGYFWLSYDSFDALAPWRGRLQAFSVIPQSAPIKPVAEVLDGSSFDVKLSAIRNSLNCGDIAWKIQGSEIMVRGYVGSSAELTTIKQAVIKAAPNAQITLEVLPWPQCEVRRRLTNYDAGISLTLEAGGQKVVASERSTELRQGDYFGLTANIDAKTTHLTVVYIQADGTAIPLFNGQPASNTSGDRLVELGINGKMYRVAAPFGPEAVIAISSNAPIFLDLPANGMVERKFLDLLNRQLMEATQRGRTINVANLMLTTRAN